MTVNNSISPGAWSTQLNAVMEMADFQILSSATQKKKEIIEPATQEQKTHYENNLNKGVEQAAKNIPLGATDLTSPGTNIA